MGTGNDMKPVTAPSVKFTYEDFLNSIGAVFAAPFDVVFSDLSVVEPDLLYISRERTGSLTSSRCPCRRWDVRTR